MKKIIVKVGTSTLTQGSLKLSRRWMLGLVEQFAHLHEGGNQILLVSSGAVAAGRELLGIAKGDPSEKQLCASTGQVILMQTWLELFSLFDLNVGQVLLTKEDLIDEKKQGNARDVLNSMLLHGVIPIINENNAMVAQEACWDNDNLAAHVAKLISPDLVILLTDQEGLFTADPRRNPDATLIEEVRQIDASILSSARGTKSSYATGGMATKIEAAQTALQSGVKMVIASSSRPNVLIDIVEGKHIGTQFLAEGE